LLFTLARVLRISLVIAHRENLTKKEKSHGIEGPQKYKATEEGEEGKEAREDPESAGHAVPPA
jgi:hypothetical protein